MRWPVAALVEVIKRIRAVGPMVPLPVFCVWRVGRDYGLLRAHARICFRRFGEKVKICTIKGYRFCVHKALRGVREFHAVYEHCSDLIRCRLVLLWMYRSFLYRTFFSFSTISSCCRCKILRWEMCRRFFIHIQLVFMHFIAVVPLLTASDGGCDRER